MCTVLYSLYSLKLIGPEGTHRLYSVYSFVHSETDWSQRDPQVVQCVQFVQFVHFETDWSRRDPQVVQCVQFVHFETDWSQRDPQVVQCVQFCTVCTF